MTALPLSHHFEDTGLIVTRTSWDKNATVVAFKAGPPEGHRVAALLPQVPEWRLDSGHAHPDAGSFIIWAEGRYLTGDTGYAGLPSASNHNTLTFGGIGQGVETQHDVWRQMNYRTLDGIRMRQVDLSSGRLRVIADLAAAYRESAGVRSFTRTFAWDGGSVFTVSDAVTLVSPKTAEWYLQSDTPFERAGASFQNARPGKPALRVSIASPKGIAATTEPATVQAPGPPGSIEKGTREQRGHLLRLVAPAATAFQFDVKLEVVPRAGG